MGDYVRVAGRIPLPPRFAFGAWWSRYWDYTDQELDELVQGFHENDVPLDVLRHRHGLAYQQTEQLTALGEKISPATILAGAAIPGTKYSFPTPKTSSQICMPRA
jgi:hypothetical protein